MRSARQFHSSAAVWHNPWHCMHAAMMTFKAAVLLSRSVFYLPPPLPLNHLVADMYGGPVLVLQGAKDPLNDAMARAAALGAACSNVRVQLIDGGHCPHDEVPAVFNEAVMRFMQEVEYAQGARQIAAMCCIE